MAAAAGLSVAADLGWDTLALFGCHPMRPLDHLNGAGLLWRISGGKISSMRTDWATIEINGAQRIIHSVPRWPTSCCRGDDGLPPLVRVLFTNGMIAADFLGDPKGTGLDMPSQTHCASGGLTAGKLWAVLFGCNSAHGARRLHGSTKVVGVGRLWKTCCSPSISIVAQSRSAWR
jgi:hypothetical protein